MRIFLVGFMGVGKTTIGRCLAELLDWDFVDLDREIEQRAGRTVADIFARENEEGFRLRENAALETIAQATRIVVATGGGTMAVARNSDLIRKFGVSVWLDSPLDVLLGRVERSPRERPLFRDREQAAELFRKRKRAYQRADLCVEVGANDRAPQIAERIVALLKESSCAT